MVQRIAGIGREDYRISIKEESQAIFLIDNFVNKVADKYENMVPGRTVTLIEDASSGTFLYQALKNKITNVKPVLCKGTKRQRFDIVALKTEQGKLLFPEQYAS